MGDLGQGVGLIHELGKLTGAEELLHRGDDGLGIDQIMGLQGAVGVLRHGELLLDGALNSDEAHTEAVFQQFSNAADAAIAQVVNIVLADRSHFIHPIGAGRVVLLEAQKVVHRVDEVLGAQRAQVQFRLQAELGIHLVPADLTEIVFLGIEEHGLEQLLAGFQGGGLAWPDLLEELLGGLLGILGMILGDGLAKDLAGGILFGETDREVLHVVGQEHLQVGLHEGVVGLEQHFAGVHVDHILEQNGAVQEAAVHGDVLDPGFDHLLEQAAADGFALFDDDILGLGVLDVLVGLLPRE